MIQEIAAAAEEQSASVEEVTASVEDVSSISQKSAAGTEEASAAAQEQAASMDILVNAAQELARLSSELQAEVSKFKLGDAVTTDLKQVHEPGRIEQKPDIEHRTGKEAEHKVIHEKIKKYKPAEKGKVAKKDEKAGGRNSPSGSNLKT